MAPDVKVQKNRYYRLLGNQKINWRNSLTVKIFLLRKGKNGEWYTIISTVTSLSFKRMIEILLVLDFLVIEFDYNITINIPIIYPL